MRYCNQRPDHHYLPKLVKRGVMKIKVVSMALVLGLVTLLGACDSGGAGGGGGTSPSPAESPAEVPSPSPS